MTPLHLIAGAIGLAASGFVALGIKSQKGKAPGLQNLNVKDSRLADCGTSPNCVCSEEDTQPERYVKPLMATMEDAVNAIEAMGGTITTRRDDYISATFMSKTFKFVDDVELRDGGTAGIHIRSSSRVGYSDQGANRRRVKALRAKLDETAINLS